MLGLAVISIVLSLIASRPVVVADESGLTYRHRRIEWEHIKDVVRVPRLENRKAGRKRQWLWHFGEGPIDIQVSDIVEVYGNPR